MLNVQQTLDDQRSFHASPLLLNFIFQLATISDSFCELVYQSIANNALHYNSMWSLVSIESLLIAVLLVNVLLLILLYL